MEKNINDATTEPKTQSEKNIDFYENSSEDIQNRFEVFNEADHFDYEQEKEENIEEEKISDNISISNISDSEININNKIPTELMFLTPIYILCSICNLII